MAELTMAPSLACLEPTLFFELSDDLSHLHQGQPIGRVYRTLDVEVEQEGGPLRAQGTFERPVRLAHPRPIFTITSDD